MNEQFRRLAAPRRIVIGGALASLGGRARAQVRSDTVADIVLRNGKILTVDPAFSTAQATAIAGNRILAVGDNAAMGRFTGPATRVIDLKGATVVPGLRDSHLHTLGVARDIFNVDLQNARSIAEIQTAIAARVAVTPKGEWVIGASGWHEGQIRERRMPTRQELDAVAPDNPVWIPRGGHVALANSLALTRGGITRDTPDPKGGNIVRDAGGEPTGMLVERPAMVMVNRLLPPDNRERLVDGLKRFSGILATLGVTATTEPGASPDEIGAYMDLWRQKGMKHRVRIMQRVGGLADVKSRSAVIAPNFGDDFLRIGGFKSLFDGGIEAARLSTPYQIVPGEQTDPSFLGQYLLPPGGDEEALAMFDLAAERGWQYQVHAVGDATIDRLIGLWEKIAVKHDIAKMRWAVLHCMLASDEALDRIKKLGVRVTVQDQSVRLASNMIRYWGDERAGYCTPTRSITAKGIPTGAGTDAPVAHWSPYLALWWMVTRKVEIGGVVTQPLGPEQAISRAEALRLYTMGSADVDFMEDRAGSIEPGKLADLAVLSDDYMTVPEDGIRDLHSLLTIVDGQIVHEA